MRAGFTLYMRLSVILSLICLAFFWSIFAEKHYSKGKLVGLYGLAPISVFCPRDGRFVLKSDLNTYVQESQEIATFQSEELMLLKQRLVKEVQQNINEIKVRVLETKLALQEKTIQAKNLAKTKSAELWAYRGQRLKLEAEIAALNRGVKGLKKAVSRGRAPLKDLIQVQADIKSAQVQINPQKNREFALQVLVQDLEKNQIQISRGSSKSGSNADTNLASEMSLSHEDMLSAQEKEIEAWQHSLSELNQLIEVLEHIRAPSSGLIINNRSDVDYSQPQSCLAGGTLLTIQPTKARLRLWQLDQLDQKLKLGQQLEIQIESELLSAPLQLKIMIIKLDPGLTMLPQSLQTQANQSLAKGTFFGELPLIYGIGLEAEILGSGELGASQLFKSTDTDIPWGLPFHISWSSR